MTVNQWNTERKILRHSNDCIINGRIAMRMVFTDYITDNARRLEMLGIPSISKTVHCIKTATVNRL